MLSNPSRLEEFALPGGYWRHLSRELFGGQLVGPACIWLDGERSPVLVRRRYPEEIARKRDELRQRWAWIAERNERERAAAAAQRALIERSERRKREREQAWRGQLPFVRAQRRERLIDFSDYGPDGLLEPGTSSLCGRSLDQRILDAIEFLESCRCDDDSPDIPSYVLPPVRRRTIH